MSPSHVAVNNNNNHINNDNDNDEELNLHDNNYHFLIPKVNDTVNYMDSLVDQPKDYHQQEEEEDFELEFGSSSMQNNNNNTNTTPSKSTNTRFNYNFKFPLNQCSFDHLKDTAKSLKLGLISSVDAYTSTFKYQDNNDKESDDDDDDDDSISSSEYDESMIDYDDYDEESDYDEDYDEEVILPINHLHISSNQPQPLVSILKSQSSTNKRSSSITSSTSTTSSSSLELSIITSKINSIIEEYFPTLINDEDFIDIKNYVINYLIIFLTKTELTKSGSDSNNNTSNDNINSRILNLFIQKQFKLNLIEKIFEILIEKYESIKIDSLLDYFLDFNSKSSSHNKPNDDDKMGNYFIMGRLLHNPKFYDRYKIIWKLDHLNYKYYDKSYFIDDYFNNLNYNYKYTYHKHDEWELLLNKHQFSMNFDKFFIYYNRDLKAGRIYDDDGLDDDDDNDNDEGDDIDERFGNTSSDENYDYYDYSSSSIGMINSNSSNYHRSSTSSTSSSSSSTSGNSMFSDRRVSEVSTGSSFSSKSLIMNKKALTTTTNTNVATTIPKPKTVEKSLRFNDHIDVLSINRHEPVYYLNCIRI